MTTDPIYGRKVDDASALCVERDGQAFYFCGTHCWRNVLSAPATTKHGKEFRGCCQPSLPDPEPSDRSTARIPAGTGAGVMKRIAVPWIGGVFSAMILTLFVIPPAYVMWRWWSESKRGPVRKTRQEASGA